jgi:hypothetical protein
MTSQTPRELAHNAEISRARLDLTIDRLERRLSPVGLVDEAIGMMKRAPSLPIVDRGLSAARENPLPIMLIAAGAGLFAWRLWAERANGSHAPAHSGNGARHATRPADVTSYAKNPEAPNGDLK